jgi:hypothetical protein
MNWKNVAHLMRIDRKSGRRLRGRRLTRYRESRLFTYLVYGGALALGLTIGALVGVLYRSASSFDPNLAASIDQGMPSFFIALPTTVLIYSLVFTMLQQIQRSGAKLSTQVPYWLPITWQEHTLASILANLFGFPLASIISIGSAITVFSTFTGQIGFAASTTLALCAAAFTASASTEIFRILQVRFIGAVYKSTGRAAVWVRFVGSMLFFLAFYIVYFYIISGSNAIQLVQSVASAQSTIWFIPFVWLGMTLYSFMNGLVLQGTVFSVLSLAFVSALVYLATLLNRRFGLYEPPAIRVSRGAYAPKAGFLGRLGFSTVEAALIRKDLRAFTRRRELMVIFIVPIVVIIAPLMQTLGTMNRPVPPEASPYLFALIFLLPASVMAMSIGTLMLGQEGQAIWQIYSSPISAKSLVKSKFSFIIFMSVLVMAITGAIGLLGFHPSLKAGLVALFESFFLVFTLGSISLSNGITGADFTEAPRPRMVRTGWSLINLVACFLAAMTLLSPFVPYMLSLFIPKLVGPLIELYQAVIVSAIISVVITLIFYRIALKNAGELLKRAEI